MAFKLRDNIRETFTGAGSTTITLGGAAQYSRALSSELSNGDTFWGAAQAGAEISVGLFTYTSGSPGTVAQTSVFYSSNSNSPVTFSSGAAGQIYIDLPAKHADHLNFLPITVTSAATMDIGAVNGVMITSSGTTGPVTSLGTEKNKFRIVTWSGQTITCNTTSLKLQGVANGANRVTTSGALGIYVSDNSGNWTEVYYSASYQKEVLTGNRTYYVRTDGADTNSGLVDSAGGAFLTVQKAMDIITSTLDVAGYTVTVQIKDGTYTAGVQIKNWVGGGVIVFQGNSGTPANVFFNVTGAAIFDASYGILPGIVRIKDLKTKTTTSGFHIVSRSPGRLQFTNIVFDAAPLAHVVTAGGLIEPYGSYSIIGAAQFHWITDTNGVINVTGADLPSPIGTITITGTPAFSQFAHAEGVSMMAVSGIMFSGSATGTRYGVSGNALIRTGSGASATYLPGNVNGAATEGGQYT